MRRLVSPLCLICLALLVGSLGCDEIAFWRDTGANLPPLEAMNRSARRGDWSDAWKHSDAVLSEHRHDAKVLAQVAWVAYESKHLEESADLLMAACRAENFKREERVQQALVATIHVGKLFDGLSFLTEAVQAQPGQLGTRRLIYDLLISMENRTLAEPHGRFLVQKRQFDSELLASLCNTDRNASDETSWETVIARNPEDRRPLIPQAMIALDNGHSEDAFELLQEILASHPGNLQAQLLMGEALVSMGKFASLEGWLDQLEGEYADEPEYWITIGRWASFREEHASAARAFWEATQRDAYLLDAWVRLIAELGQLPSSADSISPDVATAIEQRIKRLRHLEQTKYRFIKSRSISRSLAIEIASTLVDLGRLWEAEAWLATATKLPEDPNVDVVAARQQVVAQMTRETPWQVRQGHPELQLDLSFLPLPMKVTP